MADWLANLLAGRPADQDAPGGGGDAFAPGGLLNPWGLTRDEAVARWTQAERAGAQQGEFNRGIQTGTLDVSRQNARTSRYSAETGRYSAETDRAYREALVKQAAEDLAFKYHQQAQTFQLGQGNLAVDTLRLGAGLRGPRDWDQYLETAAQAGANPILQGAMQTWSSLTNPRPNTGAVSGPLPQRFDLNALASDFMGGVGPERAQQRDPNLDAVAMGNSSPGWWQSLSPDERERSLGYWESRGWSPNDVLSRLSYTATNQGLGFSGV